MFIKVTNDNEKHKGEPLYFNINQITAIFQADNEDGSKSAAIFGGPTGLEWKLQETIEEVLEKVKFNHK